jgi:hypothetical protein
MQGVRYVTSRMGSVRALPSRIFLGEGTTQLHQYIRYIMSQTV